VSLGRFQSCNFLEMDNFRLHGVEDELDAFVLWDGSSSVNRSRISRRVSMLFQASYLFAPVKLKFDGPFVQPQPG